MTGSGMRALWALLMPLLLGAPVGTRAEEPLAIDAALDRERIVVGSEEATLTVTVRTTGLKVPDVPTPRVRGLIFQSAGTAQNFSIASGGISRSVTLAFRVRAESAGTYTIGPIRVVLGSRSAVTRPLTLTAEPPGAAYSTPHEGPAEPWADSSGRPPEVFARLTVDRPRAVWNQQITAHLRVYARVQIEGPPDYEAPETPGFWVEELGQPRSERTRVGGVEYSVSDLAWALFPTRTGQLTIGPARIRCRVQRVVGRSDPWGLLNMQEVVPEDIALETKPVAVTVAPLPPGAPPEFAGAVGSFTLSVRVDRLEAAAGEPLTVTTVLRGEGNVASLRDPRIGGPGGVRHYAAGSSTSIDRASGRVRGERVQQMAYLPDTPGELRIEPVRFAWFDPEAGGYRSARSEAISVRIHPAAPHAGRGNPSLALGPLAARRAAPGPFGTLSLGPPEGSVVGGVVATLAYALAWGLTRRRERRRGDPRIARAAGIESLLGRDLRLARSRLAAGRTDAAAALAGDALLHGVAIRFDVARTGETRRELLDAARARGATEAEGEEVASLLAALDALAYAPPTLRQGTAAREIARIEALLKRFRRDLA